MNASIRAAYPAKIEPRCRLRCLTWNGFAHADRQQSRSSPSALGVSETAVRKAEKTGRIRRAGDGSWNVEQVKAAWRGNTDPVQQREVPKGLRPVPEEAVGAVKQTLHEQLVLLVLETEIAQRRGEADPADIVGGERAQDLGGNAQHTHRTGERAPQYSTRACSRCARADSASRRTTARSRRGRGW